MILGITGGIGSGKSYVANLLVQRGIPVYYTDDEAKRLMTESESIRNGLVTLLGVDAYTSSGALNKSLLASYIFSSSSHAAQVNAIVHPVVRTDFLEWCSSQTSPVLVVESAILYESGFDALVDRVVWVKASPELCVKRAMCRDGVSEEHIRERMAAQMSDEEREAHTPYYIIENDGQADLEATLDALLLDVMSGR